MKIFIAGDYVQSEQDKNYLIGEKLKEIINDCSTVCCNFEGPVEYDKMIASTKIGPSIHQSQQALLELAKNRFNLVTLANNHIADFGKKGIEATLSSLRNVGIVGIGAGNTFNDIYSPYYIEADWGRIGILAIAEGGFGAAVEDDSCGYAWFGNEKTVKAITNLVKDCDYSIVICHGGAEQWNFPLPEFRELYKSLIDRGVNAIIAHHPHVPQGWEDYKNGVIFYSLGNFRFNKGIGYQNPESIAVVLDVEKKQSSYKVYFTKCLDGTVELNDDPEFALHMEKCNSILSDSNYRDIVDSKIMKVYESSYKSFYKATCNLYSGTFKQLIKTFLYRYLRREKFNPVWLYHNLMIETHYWISRRASKIVLSARENKRNF